MQEQSEKWSSFCIYSSAQSINIENMRRAGIISIERQLEAKRDQNSQSISQAFEDLTPLITMAKDMVSLAKQITSEISKKKGAITEDEAVQLKAHLLSLGIEEPVTREKVESSSSYFSKLSEECIAILSDPVSKSGGMLTLFDAYVRVNRARGFDLISPSDFFRACKLINNSSTSPIRMVTFRSQLRVLVNKDYDPSKVKTVIVNLIEENGSLTAEQLSQKRQIPMLLAKELLLDAEDDGLLCRDETIEGICFFPNLFLTNIP
ncbi:Vacuolar protein-sorting-associated protein 36 [Trichinella zimbabwensis]|uniref:Vacuolar protein-sorting-associated protein 36 n=1 Tax=Trichinella zimbabwensis TaxID=268475 RepID=A0A0V1HSZ7_9BILA|nr:Vacuolar protein-sorting-associated protein 36 [Trichinella zimbabwensis]